MAFNIDAAYAIDDLTGCWIWLRAKNDEGYGHFQREKIRYKAHRYFWEKYKGEIPKGTELDHLCRTPACVNPNHLELVTHAENCRRGLRAKLTREQVEHIRTRVSQGLPQMAVAEEMGVCNSTVNFIIRGKRWNGIESN